MRKLARVASIIVNVSKMYGKHNLNEEGLLPSPLAILGSLQIELEKIERVLEKCSKKRAPSTQGSIDEDQAMRWGVV
ncbi:hypothetical protein EDB86DRAFT_3083823 [Lactarius hatsudake]|nr:hypothetical protein EDB86DRAFT_3083823 [Lactarius hatsudake]